MARIAVVDDDAAFVDLLVASLEEDGHQVLPCFQGEQTVALLSSLHPDLIVLDLWLDHPERGGEILAHLQHDPRIHAIPILICSAAITHLENCREQLEAAGIASLAKPFELDVFLDLVGRLLHQGPAGNSTTPELPSLPSPGDTCRTDQQS